MKNFYKTLLLILLSSFLVFPLFGNAQKIKLSDGNTEFSITQTDGQSLHFQNHLSSFSAMEVNTKAGLFTQLSLQGYNHSNEEGAPMLPVLKKLIEVPYGANYEIGFNNLTVHTIQLGEYNVNSLLIPAQPPVSKSDDYENLPFVIDQEIYETDNWYGQEVVRVIDLGEMRGVKMARLEIAPFMYNPVTGELQVILGFDCEIRFVGARTDQTENEKERVYSPWFEATFNQLINHTKPDINLNGGDAIIDVAPVTYIIVSDPMFEEILQPFVQWKTKKGYNVVEAYTNNPLVGSTTTSIKNYLKNFYQSPPEGYHPQSFVLIVGDVAQVPAFNGTTNSHVTDLYYCEYTNDFFPECFYGRFSASNLSQLQPQIDKTLEYEQYTFPDPSFLDEVVMVAGADGSHQLTWGNGQINYGTQYYFNAAHGLTSHTYLQPEPSGGNYSASIRQDVSNGVAYANYSAHCSPSGWADPNFTIGHISALTNFHRYPLMVGNCCSSVEFDNNCFGEEILRAPLKGAIGYIGGSNSTYWDEDFWWGVGFENISANPSYNSDHLGAYDRTFHDRTGITTNDWFITQGQMPSAGNLTVSQSGSSLEHYYWEIYHLMGDPSLMVYFSQPPDITANYPAIMPLASETFTINTEPYAYVAISRDGVLHGATLANSAGVAELVLIPITDPGEADVVITGQNLKPFLGSVLVSSPQGAFVTINEVLIDDATGNGDGQADIGETIKLDASFKNLGNEEAANLTITISSENDFITIIQPNSAISVIAPGQTITVDDAFELSIAENIPDNETINFDLVITDGTNTWESTFSITGHAPVLEYSSFSISDQLGNNNGQIDPGETVTMIIEVNNIGSSTAFEVFGELSSSSSYISILSGQPQLFANILPDGTASAGFEIFCSESTPVGQNISFTVNINATFGISAQGSFSVIAGQIPILIIDLDANNNSASEILASITELGVVAELTTSFPQEPELYSSLFVCLGIYSDNHALSESEGQILADYLNAGGNLYMEGGDTWSYDDQTSVHSMFGINGIVDGSADLSTIIGENGSMTEGMTFSYSGDNNWIDRLEVENNGELIFSNQSPSYGCGIINQQSNYKTIGASFEFGGLSGDRTVLMEKYLIFFDLLNSMEADFSADLTNIQIGKSVQFSDLSSGNPTTFSWTFDGGTPSQSTEQNPVIIYNTPGIFDVSLSVSSGTNSSSLTKSAFINVNDLPTTQVISVSAGWNGISGCLIPENTNLFAMLDPYLDDITILQNMTGIFYPELSVNTIGNWDYQSGYMIKASGNFDLMITGNKPNSRQVTLKTGWNIIPVLSECNVNLEDIIAPVADKVTVIKTVAGTGVYWPAFNINSIGTLQSGEAYFIHVTENVTITFGDCE